VPTHLALGIRRRGLCAKKRRSRFDIAGTTTLVAIIPPRDRANPAEAAQALPLLVVEARKRAVVVGALGEAYAKLLSAAGHEVPSRAASIAGTS